MYLVIARTKNVLIMMAAFSGLALAGLVWRGTTVSGDEPVRPAPPPVAVGPSPPPAAAVELRGKVVGPDGAAVANARVYLIRDPGLNQFDHGQGGSGPVPRPRALTGRDGGFHFPLAAIEAEGRPLAFLRVLAAPPANESSMGVTWANAEHFDPSGTLARRLRDIEADSAARLAMRPEPVLRLVKDDCPLVGRVTGPGGRPVAGATVSVVNLWRLKGEDLTGWLRAVEREGADFDRSRGQYQESYVGSDGPREDQISRILTVTADQDGKFRLSGVGRERIAHLRIGGPGIVTEKIHARTRNGPALKVRHVYHTGAGQELTFYGARFGHNAPASAPITGTVRDANTGRPLKGVVILNQDPLGIYEARTVTDAEGRYRLDGVDAGRAQRLLAVAYDLPYLASATPVEPQPGGEERRVDWKLLRGVWIKGRVTDARTAKGVMCRMQYFARTDNPAADAAPQLAMMTPWGTYHTDFDGRYTIPGLPGAGIVTAGATFQADDYLRGFGADQIDGSVTGKGIRAYFPAKPGGVHAAMFNALAKVNVPDGVTEVTKDMRLDPGETLRGRVLDPDGRPLAGVLCCGTSLMGQYFFPVAASGEFAIKQYTPDLPRTVLFYHPDRKLAGSLILRGPQPKPLEVRLQPGGTLTGRIVDGKGRPRAGLVLVNRFFSFEDAPESATALPRNYYHTDKNGRFRIDGLAVGVKYSVFAQLGTNVAERGQVASDVMVKPGETKDLGDVTVERPAAESTGSDD